MYGSTNDHIAVLVVIIPNLHYGLLSVGRDLLNLQ